MCFSASASFGASVILGGAGIISLQRVRVRSQLMFAGIPILFALQQAVEGFLWLALLNKVDDSWQKPATYIFLFFAQVLWPVWIPVSILLLENDRLQRRRLYIVAVLGMICSCLLAVRLLFFPVRAEIMDYHIAYEIETTGFISILSSILYFVATVVSPFLSTVKHMKVMGTLLALTLLTSWSFHEAHFVSIWCYLAAFVSLVIIYIVWSTGKEARRES